MTSSTFWTSFVATQASPPRDQSILDEGAHVDLGRLEAAERDGQLVDRLPHGIHLPFLERLVLAGRVLDEDHLQIQSLARRRRSRLSGEPSVSHHQRQMTGPLRQRHGHGAPTRHGRDGRHGLGRLRGGLRRALYLLRLTRARSIMQRERDYRDCGNHQRGDEHFGSIGQGRHIGSQARFRCRRCFALEKISRTIDGQLVAAPAAARPLIGRWSAADQTDLLL